MLPSRLWDTQGPKGLAVSFPVLARNVPTRGKGLHLTSSSIGWTSCTSLVLDLTDSPSCQTMKLFRQAYHVLLQEPGAPHPPLTARPASPFHVVHSAPDSNTCVPWHGMASSSPGMWEHMTSQQLSTSSVQHQVLCVWPSPNLGCCLHQQEEQEVLVTCPKYLPFDLHLSM